MKMKYISGFALFLSLASSAFAGSIPCGAAVIQTRTIKLTNPFGPGFIAIHAMRAYPSNLCPKSDYPVLWTQSGLELFRKSRFPIFFAETLDVNAVTLSQNFLHPEQENSPVIIVSKSTDEFALRHELQHAEDFKEGVRDQLDARLLKFPQLQKDDELREKFANDIFEWRGYSRQIRSLIEARDTSRPFMDANQVLHSDGLPGLYESQIVVSKNIFNLFYRNELGSIAYRLGADVPGPKRDQVCELLKSFQIKAPYLEIQDLIDCEK